MEMPQGHQRLISLCTFSVDMRQSVSVCSPRLSCPVESFYIHWLSPQCFCRWTAGPRQPKTYRHQTPKATFTTFFFTVNYTYPYSVMSSSFRSLSSLFDLLKQARQPIQTSLRDFLSNAQNSEL